jgi:hypothetical protein
MAKDQVLRRTPAPAAQPHFEIRKTFWGYVVRGAGGPPMMLQVAQGVVLAFGAAFTAGALLLVTSLEPGGDLDGMRGGLTVVLSSLALLLIWFATRGGVVELQLDLARGELRELVRHRVGRATVLGRYGLEGGAALMIDRSGPPGSPCSLMLRLREGGEALCIARGPEPALIELRRRLDQELRRRAGAASAKGGRIAA